MQSTISDGLKALNIPPPPPPHTSPKMRGLATTPSAPTDHVSPVYVDFLGECALRPLVFAHIPQSSTQRMFTVAGLRDLRFSSIIIMTVPPLTHRRQIQSQSRRFGPTGGTLLQWAPPVARRAWICSLLNLLSVYKKRYHHALLSCSLTKR